MILSGRVLVRTGRTVFARAEDGSQRAVDGRVTPLRAGRAVRPVCLRVQRTVHAQCARAILQSHG